MDVQITKWLHVFFIFKSAGEGEGWFEGDYLINLLQEKPTKKQTVTQLYC